MNKKQTGMLGVVLVIIAFVCLFFLGKDYLPGHTDSDASYIAEQSDEINPSLAPEQSAEMQMKTEIETETDQSVETQIETETEQDDTVCKTQPAETKQETQASQVVQQINTAIQTETAGESTESTDLKYKFRKPAYLTEHFEKHGAEFPYATEEEYLAGANKVIGNPNALHKLEAEDGDDVYYVESTNEFVIVSTDGYIRTYFKPNSGIDYYNRQ